MPFRTDASARCADVAGAGCRPASVCAHRAGRDDDNERESNRSSHREHADNKISGHRAGSPGSARRPSSSDVVCRLKAPRKCRSVTPPKNKSPKPALFFVTGKRASADHVYHAFHHKLTSRKPRPATRFSKTTLKNERKSEKKQRPPRLQLFLLL